MYLYGARGESRTHKTSGLGRIHMPILLHEHNKYIVHIIYTIYLLSFTCLPVTPLEQIIADH